MFQFPVSTEESFREKRGRANAKRAGLGDSATAVGRDEAAAVARGSIACSGDSSAQISRAASRARLRANDPRVIPTHPRTAACAAVAKRLRRGYAALAAIAPVAI